MPLYRSFQPEAQRIFSSIRRRKTSSSNPASHSHSSSSTSSSTSLPPVPPLPHISKPTPISPSPISHHIPIPPIPNSTNRTYPTHHSSHSANISRSSLNSAYELTHWNLSTVPGTGVPEDANFILEFKGRQSSKSKVQRPPGVRISDALNWTGLANPEERVFGPCPHEKIVLRVCVSTD